MKVLTSKTQKKIFLSFCPLFFVFPYCVLDETIELLKGGKKEVLENIVKIDAQLVENIIEASGESHGSSSVATRDTKDFLFSNEKLEVRDGLDEDSLEIKGIQDEFRKLIENGNEEEDSGNFQRAMEKTDEMLENNEYQVTEIEKENEEYENVEKVDKIDETDPEIMQEELNVVTNRVYDEQNTLELLQGSFAQKSRFCRKLLETAKMTKHYLFRPKNPPKITCPRPQTT